MGDSSMTPVEPFPRIQRLAAERRVPESWRASRLRSIAAARSLTGGLGEAGGFTGTKLLPLKAWAAKAASELRLSQAGWPRDPGLSNFPLSRLETRLVDPGPHQCDDFCPSRIGNDEFFDLQRQIVIKWYRCATARLPVYRINENINRLSFDLFMSSLGMDTNTFSLCEPLVMVHWWASLLPLAPFTFSFSRYLQLMKAVKRR
jgi:hypothetical protein